ncbi:MAG: Fe(2+) transporter permease subunit FeoB [Deltaproteobacteria bacterium]|nr:Fe(2+) transporter permease subunit FeoB [Deltaproteobacteria bacterium]MBW2354784.1 Fe(2+) transporter permease subunit FeoB [Deltaproteobacteria bacterium]
MSAVTICLAGNPNCGKTTLFNALTGAKQRVGNWPGVTVERKTGVYAWENKEIQVVDLPGIYSLSALSLDEKISRDYVVSGEPDLIVNIVDASNLERNLYLTVQLLEMKVPMVVALNMMDVVEQRGIRIRTKILEQRLGCPVVPIVANKDRGISELKRTINKAVLSKKVSSATVDYPAEVEQAIKKLIPIVQKGAATEGVDPRWLSLKLLEGDDMALGIAGTSAGQMLEKARKGIETRLGEDTDMIIAEGRYGFINAICREVVQKRLEVRRTVSDAIDNVVLNRIFGIPLFLLAMYLTFMITINVGGCFIDFFDIFFGTICVEGFGALLGSLHLPDWLIALLAGGIGGGIQTMATFIPPIGFMFLCLSLLEDSGYMARAAFVMDRFMRFIGLPGKSFVPMLVGFGCNVPAIMATRTLENERDRTLTVMMNPFMSCGARLPVYALFAAAFFPRSGSTLVFGLYLTGIALAMMTGFILKSTVLKGEASHFIMELPPYHIPTVRGVFIHTYDRLKQFMFRAGKILLPIFIILAFLNSMGTDGSFGHEDSQSSVLSMAGRAITPIFQPMGLTRENWPATVGIFTGIFAKEAVVGTLNALYGTMEETGEGEEEGFSFWGGIKEAFASIPAAFVDLGGAFTDPLGIGIEDDLTDLDAVAEEQEVSKSTFGAMVKGFDGGIGAIAYLLFVLIYYPCLAAIAAIYRETNLRWTVFAGTYLTLLAWAVATVFYQLGTFGRHPGISLMWVFVLAAAFGAFIYGLKRAGKKAAAKSPRDALFQHA